MRHDFLYNSRMADRPFIVIVDDEPEELSGLTDALTRRFGADYRTVSHLTPESAITGMERMKEEGDEAALVIADQWMPGMTGIEVLGRANEIYPNAQRGLLVDWGDRRSSDTIIQGCALGHLENYLYKPWAPPEIHLYPLVSEFLAAWVRSHGPRMELVQIVGDLQSAAALEMSDVLHRTGIPHGLHDAASDRGAQLLKRARMDDSKLPIVILPDGHAMIQPSIQETMDALGVTDLEEGECDLLVIGAGPAGLAAAVYAASEGLKTVIVEREAIGGQAGTSSLIRNYLGFPRGITGAELAQRAYQQAWLFSAKFLFAREVRELRAEGKRRIVELSDGRQITARSVLIATGARYRTMGIPSVERFEGRSFFYTTFGEIRWLEGAEVCVIGGGNSAGQAAVHMAKAARQMHLAVRGESLELGMSDYLVKQVYRTPNVQVHLSAELIEAEGEMALECLRFKNRATGDSFGLPANVCFALIGAAPNTDWLEGAVCRDERGYILTGNALMGKEWQLDRPPSIYETSMPGVYAVGDARKGSVKRVATAAGEGSVAVQSIHEYLSTLDD